MVYTTGRERPCYCRCTREATMRFACTVQSADKRRYVEADIPLPTHNLEADMPLPAHNHGVQERRVSNGCETCALDFARYLHSLSKKQKKKRLANVQAR